MFKLPDKSFRMEQLSRAQVRALWAFPEPPVLPMVCSGCCMRVHSSCFNPQCPESSGIWSSAQCFLALGVYGSSCAKGNKCQGLSGQPGLSRGQPGGRSLSSQLARLLTKNSEHFQLERLSRDQKLYLARVLLSDVFLSKLICGRWMKIQGSCVVNGMIIFPKPNLR